MPPRVLLASRLPDQPNATIRAAARLAEQIGGELMLVYVAVELSTVSTLQGATGEDPEALRARMSSEIEADARAFLNEHVPDLDTGIWLVEGEVVEEITRIAAREKVDYLVIGTERRSKLKQVILGSTTQEILRHAPCPVVVVPSRG
ncbi:MAG: universal stress protein [Gemmatimonadota bacterium]